MKLYRSELAANDILRRYCAPRPFLLLRRVPVLRRCDAFVTNFTAPEFPLEVEIFGHGRFSKFKRASERNRISKGRRIVIIEKTEVGHENSLTGCKTTVEAATSGPYPERA
ncbi:hypothetical protein EVAR_18306_1 [Eumeta japonica]|uniref:Uncharacterized protein n=1 Tax=Eumeta variegata TaxID=151549 RepID=A0A4C1V8J0_EUMVA|nr:hypothetical protein EVAR_18306_1 [Eumeta japonica]